MDIKTTKQVAQMLGTDEWRVRRLYETGRLPEPERFAGRRAIPRDQIPAIVEALRERGWLQSAPDQAGQSDADCETKNGRRMPPPRETTTADQIGADAHGCYPTRC